METGEQQTDDLLEESLKKIAVNECCTLVYTVSIEGRGLITYNRICNFLSVWNCWPSKRSNAES